MTTELPTGLGAVVSARLKGESAETRWIYIGRNLWHREWGSGTAVSDELKRVTVLHDGWTPPTPEPTRWGAVVRDANGHRFRRGTAQWTSPDVMTEPRPWGYLCQPVEVLFEGVDK